MYLFIYKTTHINGRYYIGRHQTENLNDGYLGSGRWVHSIKDKSVLSREIITEAKSFEELYKLEEYYIDLHWDDPLCMNMKKASIGSTSEDTELRVKNGTHPWQKRANGTSSSSDRVKDGTHNWLKKEDGTSLGGEICIKQLESGTHPFQRRADGTSVSQEQSKIRVENGSHNFLKRSDGSSLQQDRVKNGTHHFLGNIPCVNKKGEIKCISKEQYYSQQGSVENWEWVHNSSKEAKRRRS